MYTYTYIYIYIHTCYTYMHARRAQEARIPHGTHLRECIMHHTGWRRFIGSPKLHVIFHKRATTDRALLRKMTYEDKASYVSSPPCARRRKACARGGKRGGESGGGA